MKALAAAFLLLLSACKSEYSKETDRIIAQNDVAIEELFASIQELERSTYELYRETCNLFRKHNLGKCRECHEYDMLVLQFCLDLVSYGLSHD